MFSFQHPPSHPGGPSEIQPGYMYAVHGGFDTHPASMAGTGHASTSDHHYSHPPEYRSASSSFEMYPGTSSEGNEGQASAGGMWYPTNDARAAAPLRSNSAGSYDPGASPILIPPLPASVEQSIAIGHAPWANYNSRASLDRGVEAGLGVAGAGNTGSRLSQLSQSSHRHSWHVSSPAQGNTSQFDSITNPHGDNGTQGGQGGAGGPGGPGGPGAPGGRDEATHPFAFAYPNPSTPYREAAMPLHELDGRAKNRLGDWGEDFARDDKRARANGHGEFEKDLSLLQTCLSDLVALLQPFASTTGQPHPPSPAPFLHTRFLRLAHNINHALLTLGPASHTLLAPEFTARPPFPEAAKTMTTAEKEMEVIRKRRDALIAKAAQAKAAAANQPAPTGQSGLSAPPPHPAPGQADYLAVPGGYANGNREGIEGRCHGCGVGVSQEWRPGPDGPQTLCDLCGAHYEKLSRRRLSISSMDRPMSAGIEGR